MKSVASTGPMPVCHLAIVALIIAAVVIFEQWQMPLLVGLPALCIWFAACTLRIRYTAKTRGW